MSYQRKREDKKRLTKMVIEGADWWPSGAYVAQRGEEGKPHLKRYWKSKDSSYKWCKKQSHKTYRRFIKRNDFYSKKAYDLWSHVC